MKRAKIGIDIGGTKVRAILLSDKRVIKAKEIKTPKSLAEFRNAFLKLIINLDDRNNFTGGIIRIGIGAAGVISGTKIALSPNIKYFKNFDFKFLASRFQILDSIKLDNDARCFLRAEISKNPALRKKRVLGLTLGTGIGRALAKNSQVLNIKKFEYPERWEGRYQKVRDRKDNQKLADFLAERLAPIIKKYTPRVIVIGGGVSSRKGFLATFRHSQECRNVDVRIIKPKLGQNSVAIGAALLHKS